MMQAYRARRLLSVLLGLVASAACSAKTSNTPSVSSAGASSESVCTAGDTRACVGPGACAGGQACDGSGQWSACDCGVAGDGGASSQAGTGGVSGGSGGPSGGSSGNPAGGAAETGGAGTMAGANGASGGSSGVGGVAGVGGYSGSSGAAGAGGETCANALFLKTGIINEPACGEIDGLQCGGCTAKPYGTCNFINPNECAYCTIFPDPGNAGVCNQGSERLWQNCGYMPGCRNANDTRFGDICCPSSM
jgi:hypothetical protein